MNATVDSPIVRWTAPGSHAIPRDESIGAVMPPMFGGALVVRALDEVDFGMMVLTAEGRPVFANRAALRACEDGEPFCLDRGCMHVARPADAPAFAWGMHQALNGRRSLATFDGHEEGEDRGTDADVRFLAFIPLAAEAGPAMGLLAPLVLLVFGRPQLCGPLTVQFFAHQHGMTLAECAVLSGLCNGSSPRHIARERGIAVSTVRTHIMRIREKAGVRTIVDLLRIASMLPPLLRVVA